MDRIFEESEHRGLGWGGVSLRRRGGEKETVCLSREKRLSEDRVHHPVPHTTSGNSKQPSSL